MPADDYDWTRDVPLGPPEIRDMKGNVTSADVSPELVEYTARVGGHIVHFSMKLTLSEKAKALLADPEQRRRFEALAKANLRAALRLP